MSEWFYVRLAYGLAWTVLTGYTVLLLRRRAAAVTALRGTDGGEG